MMASSRLSFPCSSPSLRWAAANLLRTRNTEAATATATSASTPLASSPPSSHLHTLARQQSQQQPHPFLAAANHARSRTLLAFQSTNTTTPKEEEAEKKAEEGAPAAEEPTVSETEKKLAEEVTELKKKSDELMDKYRRSIAESDNMRKRLTKQIDDAKVFGIQSFCKDLLEVADVLNKAVAGVPKEALESESQYLRDMHQGLVLTESQLLQVFKRHGLEAENPLGEKFDPNRHEALFQIPAPDKEVNTVLDVQKVGYILQGRTIRPALVGVSKK